MKFVWILDLKTSYNVIIQLSRGKYMLISDRIYNYMKEKNISQLEFSKRTGISQSTVSDWRRKGTNPSADKIMIICDVLEVTPYDLLIDADTKNKKVYREVDYVMVDKASDEYQLIEMYRSIDEKQKDRFLQYALKIINEK